MENVENCSQVREVSGEVRTCHQNVVQVGEEKRKTTEKMVHEPLKSLSSVAEAERHFGELKTAKRSDNGRIGDISGGDRHLIIAFD